MTRAESSHDRLRPGKLAVDKSDRVHTIDESNNFDTPITLGNGRCVIIAVPLW